MKKSRWKIRQEAQLPTGRMRETEGRKVEGSLEMSAWEGSSGVFQSTGGGISLRKNITVSNT